MYQLAIITFLLLSICSSARASKTADETINKLKRELLTAENPSQHIFKFIESELMIGTFASPTEFENSFQKVEKIHSQYQDENYFKGLCLLTFRMHLVSKYNDAYYYLYKARKLFSSFGQKDNKTLKLYYNINASSAFYFSHFHKAETYALKEFNCKTNSSVDSISILNMLGLIKFKLGQLDISLNYYSKGLSISKRIKSELWMGLISGNMGNIYLEKKEYTKARKLCEYDYKFSMKVGAIESGASALSSIILIDIAENKTKQAKKHFKDLKSIKIKKASLAYRIFIEKTNYLLLEKLGEYREAFNSFKLYNSLSDSLEKDKAEENIKRTEFQIDFEHENAKLTILEERKKRDEILFYGIASFSLLGFIALIIILYQVIKRRNRERFITLLQKKRLDEELKRTEIEMRKTLTKLMEKNELIELLNSELELIQETSSTESSEKLKLKDKLTSFKLLTEDDWIEFKRLFTMLNPHFFENLHNHFRDLTSAEIRFITLSKLNLDTTEISRALGISPDSVRKTNLRLRKKVGIENQEELNRLILSI